jgi:hypothetical protein
MDSTAKEKLVDAILENETYMPDSGLIRRLRTRLLRLSQDDLSSLKLIIELKSKGAWLPRAQSF